MTREVRSYNGVPERSRQATAVPLSGRECLQVLAPRFYARGDGVVCENFLEVPMPKKETIERAHRDKRAGKSASTQAGEFVREEIEAIRKGEHGARSAKQAIAIGLSKARRAGVKLPVPEKGSVPEETRRKAKQDLKKGQRTPNAKPSRKRSEATLKALKREGRSAASKEALSKQARSAARKRTPAQRSAAAKKAARTRAK
jgi:hypothetical protein